MKRPIKSHALIIALAVTAAALPGAAVANSYREKGKPVVIAGTALGVTPPRDWNRLSFSPGKKTETWTLDGEELNDVTFFAGIAAGSPLVREVSKKHKPLPKFTGETLLVEVPELLEGTYRAAREVADFKVSSAKPDRFLGRDGIRFTFDYVDGEDLPRRGEGRATIVNGLLYLVTYTAPRLHYYEQTLEDFHTLSDTATLN